MSSLRDDANISGYDGTPDDSFTAGGPTQDLVDWLEAAAIYTSVTHQSFLFDWDDLEAIEKLDPTPEDRDVILVVNTKLFLEGPRELHTKFADLLGTGNHVVKLLTKPKRDGDNIQFFYWSYGEDDEYHESPDRLNAYTHGTVIAEI